MTIQIRETITLASNIADVWRFFNDINSVAQCMPTVVRHEVAEDEVVYCDLRIKLGLIPLDSTARLQITGRDVNRRIEVTGETNPGTEMLKRFEKISHELMTRLKIVVELEELQPERTEVCFSLEAKAVGQLRRIYNSVIKSQRDKLLNQLLINIEQALGTKVEWDETASVVVNETSNPENPAHLP